MRWDVRWGLRWTARRLGRPAGTVDRTRWLFAGLLLLTLVIVVPSALSGGNGSTKLLAAGAALVLASSCVLGYAMRRAPLSLDVADAAGTTVLALGVPDPAIVLGYVFAALWFRSLYTSTTRALVRCGLFAIALAAVLPLWRLVPGHESPVHGGSLLQPIPIMFLTVIIGQQLSASLFAREQTERRDAVLAAVGSRFIGLTDAGEIRRHAWAAATRICAITPGLRALRVVETSGSGFHVEASTQGFVSLPTELPAGMVSAVGGAQEVTAGGRAALDSAVGSVCDWVAVSLPKRAGSWLLVGAPKKLSPEGLLALRSLRNQVVLALRNSEVHDELSTQARSDSLTHLANRATFHSAVEGALDAPDSGAVTVLFVDLDDFKDVNDILGHGAGDSLLREIALRVAAVTRPEDVCARLGGDEFAVLLHEPVKDAERVAERLLKAIAAPVLIGTSTARVSASIGIAAAVADTDLAALIHQADTAMYAAKANGKGRLQVFEPGLLRGDQHVALDNQLAAAAGAGEFVVHYQPILALADGRCTSVEALVRWQHPERGLLYPGEFIDAAERTGAIIDIGAFVLRRACSDLATWRAEYPGSPLSVHVNVSGRQLDHQGFIDMVLRCLSDFSMPANQLVLEITESLVVDSPAAVERLNVLAQLGVVVAIDDFGTGYAALTTLRSLPLSIVKIDMSFVAGALTNPADQAVIEAIARIANRLGLQTVAEGVERPDQQRFLESVGVDGVQGYLHLRPTTAAELGVWLSHNRAAVAADAGSSGGSVVALAPRRMA